MIKISSSEIYISIDCEFDGPIPGENSMLSLGAAAFILDGDHPKKPVGYWYGNFTTLAGAEKDAATTEWWAKHPEAYQTTRRGVRKPEELMPEFIEWMDGICAQFGERKPVLVGYPVASDFMFVYWYAIRFAKDCYKGHVPPFSFSAIDIKTLAWTVLGLSYRGTHEGVFPEHWFKGAPKHTHHALDDAVRQGIAFVSIVTGR